MRYTAILAAQVEGSPNEVYIGSGDRMPSQAAPYMCRSGHIEVVVYQLPVPIVHQLQQLVMSFMELFPSHAMKTLA